MADDCGRTLRPRPLRVALGRKCSWLSPPLGDLTSVTVVSCLEFKKNHIRFRSAFLLGIYSCIYLYLYILYIFIYETRHYIILLVTVVGFNQEQRWSSDLISLGPEASLNPWNYVIILSTLIYLAFRTGAQATSHSSASLFICCVC